MAGPLNLILNYGKQKIFDAGIKILGFPGTWITHQNEIDAIKNSLKKLK